MKHKKSEIIKAYLHAIKFKIDPIGLSADDVKAQVTFNMSADMVTDFINNLDKGEIIDEYINSLVEKYDNRGK